MIVIAAFIITAVFVGYHASQEPREKMTEVHNKSLEILSYHLKQATYTLFINANFNN